MGQIQRFSALRLTAGVGFESGSLRPMMTTGTFEAGSESDRRDRVISRVTGRQLGFLPNMIQPPLLGVVNAASAVSARTLTCRAPAVPRSCSMLSVYMAVRVRPFPKLPPLEENGCGPSTLISPA